MCLCVGVRNSGALTQKPLDFPSAVQVSKIHSQEQLQKDEGEQLALITGLRTQVRYTQRIGLSFPDRFRRALSDHLHSSAAMYPDLLCVDIHCFCLVGLKKIDTS